MSNRTPQFVILPILGLLWGGFAVVVVIIGIVFVSTLSKANGAIQEAACGSIFGTIVMIGYVITKALDKIGLLLLPLLKRNRYREGE